MSVVASGYPSSIKQKRFYHLAQEGFALVRWSKSALILVTRAIALVEGITYFSLEWVEIIPDQAVEIQIPPSLAIPRIAVLVGAPSGLTIIIVLALRQRRPKGRGSWLKR